MRAFKTNPILMSVLLGLALFAAGCGGDDGPAEPATQTLTLDSATAEEFSLEALGVVNDIVAAVPELAEGSFANLTVQGRPMAKSMGDSLVWDPSQQAWTFAFAGPVLELEPPSTWTMSLDLWVQYGTAAGPQQFALGATWMRMLYGLGMAMHMVDTEGTFDMDYDTDTDLMVSYLGDAMYGVDGAGSATVYVSQVTPQVSQAGNVALDWDVDVVTAGGGCPEGTATVSSQGWTMAATYDGQGNVAWTLTGPNYQGSGSDSLDCGQPAK